MKKLLLCVLGLVLVAPALAEDISPNRRVIAMVRRYNLSNTTAESCVSYGVGGRVDAGDYQGTSQIKTTGTNTTTVAKVANSNPFASMITGDIIAVVDSSGHRLERIITKTDDNTIEADLSWNLSAGSDFTWRHVVCQEGDTAGAIPVNNLYDVDIYVQVRQLSLTSGSDGVEVHVQGRKCYDCDFVDITDPMTITQAGVCVDCFFERVVTVETYTDVRATINLTGADDGTDTGSDAEQIDIFFAGKKVNP